MNSHENLLRAAARAEFRRVLARTLLKEFDLRLISNEASILAAGERQYKVTAEHTSGEILTVVVPWPDGALLAIVGAFHDHPYLQHLRASKPADDFLR